MKGFEFNNIQKLFLVFGCFALFYLVFIDPPKVIHGISGVVINANEYCKDARNKSDCEIAVTNSGLLALYMLATCGITAILVVIAAKRRGDS